MKKQLLISILLVIVTGLKAQTNIDSLKNSLKLANHDTTRCNILFKIIDIEPSDKICIGYNNQIKKIAEKNINNPELNKDMRNKFLSIFAESLRKSARFNSDANNYEYSFDDLRNALKIQEQLNDKDEMVYTVLLLANNYWDQGDTLIAIKQYEKAYKLAVEVKNEQCIAQSLIGLGFILYEKNNLDSSYVKYLKALNIFKKLNQKTSIADVYDNISLVLKQKNKLDEAAEYNKLSLEIRKSENDSAGISYDLINAASILLLKKDYTSALINAKIAHEISIIIKSPFLILQSSNILTKIYKNQNQPVLALQMYEEYIKIRDITNNEENRKASIRNQFQVEYDKKALTDSLRTIEERKINSLELEKQQTQKAGLYIILILVLIVAGFIYNRFQLTKKQKAIIEDHQKEILASIRYAKRIQTTLMPSEIYIQKSLNRLQKN